MHPIDEELSTAFDAEERKASRKYLLETFAFCAKTVSEWIRDWGKEQAAQMVRSTDWQPLTECFFDTASPEELSRPN